MTSMVMFIGILGWLSLIIAIFIYLKIEKDKKVIKKTDFEFNNEKPKVVVIGGGTGQSVFLRGLKH